MLVVIPEGEYRNWQVDTRLANSFSYYYCRLCSFLFFSIIFYYENTKQCPFRLSSLNYLNTLEANAIHLLFCLTLIILICSNANNNKFVVLPLLPNEYDIKILIKKIISSSYYFWCGGVLFYYMVLILLSRRPDQRRGLLAHLQIILPNLQKAQGPPKGNCLDKIQQRFGK